MPFDRNRYPKNWDSEIRPRILARAGNCCEQCGLPNYAVGRRDKGGKFIPATGNGPCDAAGQGKTWPAYEPLTAKQAREFVDGFNDHKRNGKACDADGNRWFFIVLTIAHLDDSSPSNCAEGNLAAYCQSCHLSLDGALHAKNAAVTRARKKRERAESTGQIALRLEP